MMLIIVPAIQAIISGCFTCSDSAIIAGESSRANTISTPASLTELVTVIAKIMKMHTKGQATKNILILVAHPFALPFPSSVHHWFLVELF